MEQGQGNFFTRKVGPFPAWVWLAGAALLAYLYFRHSQGAGGGIAGSPTTTGGGGSITTGNTRVDKGAVSIRVNAGGKGIDNDDKDTNPDHHKHQHQPGHHHHKREKQEWRVLTVPEDMSLEQFADSRHWDADTLKDVETQKQPSDSSFKGKVLKGTQKLRKGQKVARPQLGD